MVVSSSPLKHGIKDICEPKTLDGGPGLGATGWALPSPLIWLTEGVKFKKFAGDEVNSQGRGKGLDMFMLEKSMAIL
jgi:hypothetical protein